MRGMRGPATKRRPIPHGLPPTSTSGHADAKSEPSLEATFTEIAEIMNDSDGFTEYKESRVAPSIS
ncbi:hypothetical protein GCM10023160_07840 [Brachybacterium paraconglomeratum]